MFFFFFLLKILNSSFQSEDGERPHTHTSWSSGHLEESLYDVGEERPSAPDLQVKTDSGPVKPTLGRVRAREVGYKYPPHTAVSSKSKHFRFCLVIYHCSLYHVVKIKTEEVWRYCSVCSWFHFHSCNVLSHHITHSDLQSSVSPASLSTLFYTIFLAKGRYLTVLSLLLALNMNTAYMQHKLMCFSERCFMRV